ncbi:MAG: NAD+ synthase, partial [Candidatus Omnitrophica bacterium]|nr:NAD+ synthase [Candidatus Omnitrophota bacterium]
MRITLAQINVIVGDLVGNREKILAAILSAKKKGSDVVVFPELVVTGYPPEDLLYKELFVRDNILSLKKITNSVPDIAAVVGFVDKDKQGKLYNAAAVLHQKKIIAIYHKNELPNYGVFDEKRYFTKGEGGGLIVMNERLLGVSICEDIWLEDSIVDKQVKKGADVLINISSSPYHMGKLTERIKLLQRKAKKTKSYICYCNLVGGQDELIFDGSSMVIDPKGRLVSFAKQFEEDLLTVEIEPKVRKKTSSEKIIRIIIKPSNSRPVLEKVKHPPLTTLQRVYKALVLGTHDYIRKNGFDKVLIGLSGGIDSALVAAVAVDAIGKDHVIGVTMPSVFTSKGTLNDAKKLAANLGIECREVSIHKTYQAYLNMLKNDFKNLPFGIAEENVQARIRGNILMALSNKFGWLVLTTGNKSELAVGYCTLYGDMSGGFAVIKDVSKTMVYELARYRNTWGKTVIPPSIINRAPSAELRANQKDQDSLPEYET